MARLTGVVSPIILRVPFRPHVRRTVSLFASAKHNERPSMVLPCAGVTGEFEHRDRSVLSVGASQGPVSLE